MKYRIFKSSAPFMDTDYRWFVYNGQLLCSMHTTLADAMQAVDEEMRTITVTLPPCMERYTTEDTGDVFVEDCLNGWASIGYTAGGMWVALRPGELEQVALALLAIDKHNKEVCE